jgi:hypothetical protein
MNSHLPKQISPIEAVIRRHAWVADGRNDAYKYVLDCAGDIQQINQEIQQRRSNIVDSGEKGGMSPRASPRIYLDSYLETLEEALEIITRMHSEGKTWT